MTTELANVKYVGAATQKRLAEHNITTIEQLAQIDVGELAKIPGIGQHTAPLIIESAKSLLANPVSNKTVMPRPKISTHPKAKRKTTTEQVSTELVVMQESDPFVAQREDGQAIHEISVIKSADAPAEAMAEDKAKKKKDKEKSKNKEKKAKKEGKHKDKEKEKKKDKKKAKKKDKEFKKDKKKDKEKSKDKKAKKKDKESKKDE